MTSLEGVRVLLVEDEPLLQLELQDSLEDMGCQVVGTAGRLADGLRLAGELEFDIALLDVNLDGDRVDPLAGALSERDLPFVLLTGYGTGGQKVAEAPVLEKPCSSAELHDTMLRVLGVRG